MNFQTLSKPSNRWTLALIVAATAIAGTTVFYGISQLRPTSKPSEPALAAPTIRQVTALGRLEPATEVIKVSVPATLSNDRVAKLLVQRGDSVKAGQVIAIMDSQNRLQNALIEAQAQAKVAQAELAKVKAGAKSGEIAAAEAEIVRLQKQLKGEIATQQSTIARWQAEVKTANADYNRYLSLYKEGAIAASELDRKQLTLETAQAQLNEARAKQDQSVDTLREQIRQARATLDEIAEVRPVDVQVAQAEIDKAIAAVKKAKADLAEAYIRAPSSGRILDIYAKPGEAVDSEGIAQLGQTSQMQVVAEVYQTDIGKVREGQQAIITSESFPDQLRGTVRIIGLQVIKQEVTSGEPGENLDRKVIQVRIRLNPEDSPRVANLTNLQVQVAIQPDTPSTNSQ
jgi:HlyD family secretion protein